MSFDGSYFGHYGASEKRISENSRSSVELFAALLVSAHKEDLQHRHLLMERLDQISASLESLKEAQTSVIDFEQITEPSKSVSPFFTPDELAERWKVSKATVRRMRQKGEIQAASVGGGVRITRESVLEYERNSRH
jgi:excisionase family DNA binding protein